MSRFTRTWVDIDLPSLRHNLGLVRQAIGPGVHLALVAKADAYGHGLVPISGYGLHHGADWVAVATVQEGVALREAGIGAPVLVISPILGIEAEDAVFYDLRILVEDVKTAKDLSNAATTMGKVAVIHLEVDTGLSRFGCSISGAAELAQQLATLEDVRLEGLSTHFANSSWDVVGTEEQLRRFDRAHAECESRGLSFDVVHVANSAGAVRYPSARKRMVRAGIACYGIDPYNLFAGEEKPVLSWNARVMVVRELAPNSPVSYAGTYRTKGTERIATLGVGYGDGYPRNLSNKGHVFIHGQPAPIVGLICMDQVLVDVSRIPQTQPGDVAELFGPNIRVPDVARLADTNPHEITCRIMPRVPRHYRYGGDEV